MFPLHKIKWYFSQKQRATMSSSHKYMPFKVDNLWYVVPIEYVFCVVSTEEPFPSCTLPGMPSYIERVLLMNRKLVSVIELSRFLDQTYPAKKVLKRLFMLVLQYRGTLIGLLSDCVATLLDIEIPSSNNELGAAWLSTGTGVTDYILFDIPAFYSAVKVMWIRRKKCKL